jgi:NAD(P)-dependent dehydrogenase (short-subunit alcohol dehydrogenase family)
VTKAISSTGGKAHALPGDVSERATLMRLASTLASAEGRLDGVINNAMWIKYEPVTEVSEDVLEKMLAVGFKATIWGVQALLAHRGDAGDPQIVNLASPTAEQGFANTSIYSAIKEAIKALTRTLSVELGPQGVRVNAVAPGAVPTPGARAMIGEEAYRFRIRKTPLGRLASEEDAARAIAFLFSSEASFITGEILHVDGGFSVSAG